jgi:hypothetical protein
MHLYWGIEMNIRDRFQVQTNGVFVWLEIIEK